MQLRKFTGLLDKVFGGGVVVAYASAMLEVSGSNSESDQMFVLSANICLNV